MPISNWLGKKEAIHTAGKVAYRILMPNTDMPYGNAESINMHANRSKI